MVTATSQRNQIVEKGRSRREVTFLGKCDTTGGKNYGADIKAQALVHVAYSLQVRFVARILS